ncbi:hypothetical protein B0H11DRAFT_1928189 [Mycena galericulata]|nr:hypothetical protein B0H11DRAFT_1928189 [Mycena galericulata]
MPPGGVEPPALPARFQPSPVVVFSGPVLVLLQDSPPNYGTLFLIVGIWHVTASARQGHGGAKRDVTSDLKFGLSSPLRLADNIGKQHSHIFEKLLRNLRKVFPQ